MEAVVKNNTIIYLNRFCLIATLTAVLTQDMLAVEWQSLDPGLEYSETFLLGQNTETDYPFHLLKIDPEKYAFQVISCKTNNEPLKSIDEWCQSENFIAVVNAGMFQQNYEMNIGYMRINGVYNNSSVNSYKSVFVTDRTKPDLPLAQMIDLDVQNFSKIKKDYGTIVQNIRMIKKPGEHRWAQQNMYWSELALAEDHAGNILFVFTRQPYSVHDFASYLLNSDLNIVAAHHLEGGPEASFYLKSGETLVHQVGSYETSFFENDSNQESWPIPNVIGIRPR